MKEGNPTGIIGALDRKEVDGLLRQAFHHVLTYEYGFKYVDNEEDIRAAFYYRVRQLVDFDPHWRVYLSLPLKIGGKFEKPDLCFLRSKSLSFKREEITIELLVELKNWPSRKEIIDDLEKLSRYSQWCVDRGQPDLYFAAILGNDILKHFSGKKEDLLAWIKSEASRLSLAEDNILVGYHSELYRGPWHKGYGDPWRTVARGK